MVATVYFIRHGQSQDNLHPVWAGWKDAPLSDLGERQAAALGAAFTHKTFTAVIASDLKRAHSTATALHSAQPAERQPPFTVTRGLREQHFGVAEGHPWVDNDTDPVDVEARRFPILRGRGQKFPEGESLNDLRERTAREVLDDLLFPLIWTARGRPAEETNIAVVSHGLCISELCAAIVERAPDVTKQYTFAGLFNTAWHAFHIGIKGEDADSADDGSEVDLSAPLTVEVIKMNDYTHLDGITASVATADVQPIEESKLREYLSGKAA